MVNISSQSALWQKLASFEIDEPNVSLPFSARLARENSWSRSFALRVIEEYRRFVFLCATAGHPCTPSDIVDEAWHLHMIYTRSYWERLTPLLPAPLHHEPTQGGPKEGAKFENWYARTLSAYRAAFGEEPPADIWPPAEVRFDDATVKVDRRTHLVVSRKALVRGGMVALVAVLGILAAAGWAPSERNESGVGTFFLWLVAIATVLLIIAAALDPSNRKDRRRDGQGGCSTYSDGGIHTSSDFGGHSHGHSGGHSHGDSGGHSGCSGDSGGSSSGCGSGCGAVVAEDAAVSPRRWYPLQAVGV